MQIKKVELTSELQYNFLSYAEEVIKNRAIPDIRDGLKPVHRRILWTMWDMGCKANSTMKKCARVVGDCFKYHPHGDIALYEALVRMAQPFSVGIPLITGQGNFGSIDDSSAFASHRYCVPSGTPIVMGDGTSKCIEHIQIGDMVITHMGHAKPVERVLPMKHEELIRIELETNLVIYASPNHPLLVWRDNNWWWVRAGFLKESDNLCQLTSENSGLSKADDVDPSLLTAEIDCCLALRNELV